MCDLEAVNDLCDLEAVNPALPSKNEGNRGVPGAKKWREEKVVSRFPEDVNYPP